MPASALRLPPPAAGAPAKRPAGGPVLHGGAAERAAAYVTCPGPCFLLLQVRLPCVLPPGLLFFEVQLGALLGQEHPLLVLPASVSRGEVEALLRGLVPSSRQAFIVDLGSVLQWARDLHSSLSRQAAPGASRPEREGQTEGTPPIRMPASLAAAAQCIFRLAVGAQALQLAMCMSVLLQLAGVFPAMVAAGKHQEDTVVRPLPVQAPAAACHVALVPVLDCRGRCRATPGLPEQPKCRGTVPAKNSKQNLSVRSGCAAARCLHNAVALFL